MLKTKGSTGHGSPKSRHQTKAAAREASERLAQAEPAFVWKPTSASNREHVDLVVDALKEQFDIPAPVARTGERVLRTATKNLVDASVRRQADKAVDQVTGGLLPKSLTDVLGRTATYVSGTTETVDATFDALWPPVPPSPSRQALNDALKAFLHPELTPVQRRRILSEATHDPLTSVVLESLTDVLAFLPAQLVGKGADGLATVVKANEGRFAGSFLAPHLGKLTNAKQLADSVERLRAALNTPELRTAITNAMGVLRAFGRVEGEHIAALSFDVSPEKKPALQRALGQYAVEVAEGLIQSIAPEALPRASRAMDLLRLTRLHLATADRQLRDFELEELAQTLNRLASDGADILKAEPKPASELTLAQRLEAAHDHLIEGLAASGGLNETSLRAAEELCLDFSATVATSINIFQLGTVVLDTKTTDEQRFEDIKVAAQRAGPIIVKLAQTFANLSGEEDNPSVITRAIKDLQEAVPPMSEEVVRSQLEKGLGRPVEKSFVEFDPKPFASASIGQLHRAVIKRRLLGERDVAVKVLRPDLDREFDKMSRVARLFLASVREIFPVIADFLESAGEEKASAYLRSDGFKANVRLGEETIRTFVDSFAIETNLGQERRNLNRFRRSIGIHPYVTAPRAYAQWSSDSVLTMDYVRMEKLPSLVVRAAASRAALAEEPAPKTGPLPERTSDAKVDVAARTLAYVNQQLGLKVTAEDIAVAPVPGGFQAVINTAHSMYPKVKLKFDEDGTLHPIEAPPPMELARMRRIRDRFFASLIAQVTVHGMVHGDPHKGNWGVAPDGETVVMVDFGNVLELGRMKAPLVAPFGIALGSASKLEQLVAASALGLSDLKPTDPRQKELYRAIVDALGDLSTRPILDRMAFAARTAVSVLAAHEVGLSEVYTQGLKSSLSLGGNMAGFADVAQGGLNFKSWAKAFGISTIDLADALTLRVGGTVGRMAKDARMTELHTGYAMPRTPKKDSEL